MGTPRTHTEGKDMETIVDTSDNNREIHYEGPVPEGSFIDVGFASMASPEFLFLRKALTLPTPHAVAAGLDLLVPYHSHTTVRSLDEGVYEPMEEPHTTVYKLRKYLVGIDPDEYPEERERALRVLDLCDGLLPDFVAELTNA